MPKIDRDVCLNRLLAQRNRATVMGMILSDLQGDPAFPDEQKEQIEHAMKALDLLHSVFNGFQEYVQDLPEDWECNEF